MRTALLITGFIMGFTAFAGVDLVKDGKPTADIVVSGTAHVSVKTAAKELQRHLLKISAARLPIANAPSAEFANHVYLGESRYTRDLGISLDDVQHDGFKIVAEKSHVVIVGRDIDNYSKMVGEIRNTGRRRQQEWEKVTGKNWRRPCFHAYRDFNEECGFDLQDGTGTLYGVYDLLEQLGWRWYMPVPDIGFVYPEMKDVTIKAQSIKREPEFPIRIYCDAGRGQFREEFLWQKAMKLGTSHVLPVYHAIGRLTRWNEEDQPEGYYGAVNGKLVYHSPKLSSEELRSDFLEYLEIFDETFPGIEYTSLGQPDGFTIMDQKDASAGWDKLKERGPRGRFSDYYWDFIMDIRERYMKKHPNKKFSVLAYSSTTRPPTSIDQIPENVVVAYSQASQRWMGGDADQQLQHRDEWLAKLKGDDQLFILDHYLYHRHKNDSPPIPVIFTEDMKRNFAGLYDRSVGGLVEVAWSNPRTTRKKTKLITARIGLSHLMLLLHAKLWWERDLDIPAFIDDYCERFFGPAKDEMKEFYRFGEEVWTRPGPRTFAEGSGFLTKRDVQRYFDILAKARKKAGDTIYGKRIDYILDEMEPLKKVHDRFKRTGPDVRCFQVTVPVRIDGDLEKPFWRERSHTFTPLKDVITGKTSKRIRTRTSFRWARKENALIVAVHCFEPNMDKLVAGCQVPDSPAIFDDDFVEIQLTTTHGTSPRIVVNPNGVVYDECAMLDPENPPLSYKVEDVAVRKLPDRWTIEVRIDAGTISGARPTKWYPWGVNICRQRMAGNEPEHYMLSPCGSNFRDKSCMGNLQMRK